MNGSILCHDNKPQFDKDFLGLRVMCNSYAKCHLLKGSYMSRRRSRLAFLKCIDYESKSPPTGCSTMTCLKQPLSISPHSKIVPLKVIVRR